MIELPYDRLILAAEPTYRDDELRLTFHHTLCRDLARLAQREEINLSAVYCSALSIMLSRYGSQTDLHIDVALSANDGDDAIPSNSYPRPRPLGIASTPDRGLRECLRDVSEELKCLKDAIKDASPGGTRSARVALFWGSHRADQVQENDLKSYDLSLVIGSVGESLSAALHYNAALFERETIDRMSRHFTQLLEEMVAKPNCALADLDMLSEDERLLVLRMYAGRSGAYPQACLHELFAEHARQQPDAVAARYGVEHLTYRELDEQSNQMAHYLLDQGLSSEDLVGVFLNRSAGMIVAVLGILKAGGTYVPIDVDYPAAQLKFIAGDTKLRLVLTENSVRGRFPSDIRAICMDSADSTFRACSKLPVKNRSNPESIAVVNYTSGSTGRPKAARIPHRAVVRTVRDTNYVNVTPEDKVAQSVSPSFDAAIMEIWLALANGATLVGLQRESLLSSAELATTLKSHEISVIVLNTAYVHQIGRDAPEALKGVRKVIFGGEAAEPAPLRQLLEHLGPGVLVNGYGPAEGCVITTYHEITEISPSATTVPIGRPVRNARVYLLDELQRPVPIGVPGEIYIGGDGVACGYLNRPEVTAQRFLPDVFSEKSGQLLYRTGDFARMRANGEIEFLGRSDEQIKIRGYRIELAEVRHALAAHPGVMDLFLMVREDTPGDKRLVAYVTLRKEGMAGRSSLREYAMDKLPAHMVPAAFVVVESIPLNINGKVDRQALPAPHDRPELQESYKSPTTSMEQTLSQLWQKLLRVDNIGVNDNFFDLGGHSLLAARMIAQIEKEFGANIPIATLFEAPTISQLAQTIKRRSYERAWSPLVELHLPDGAPAVLPFFCVHSLGANLVSFRNVAALMRGDRPIYGLQPHGLDGLQKPLDSIHSMASAYLDEIRKKQPRGPYFLGGICLGGVVAYEMAQQLEERGETVALTILIDSYVPGRARYLHARPEWMEYLDRHLGEMLLLPPFGRLTYLARWMKHGVIRFGRSIGFREKSSLAEATRILAEAHRRAVFSYDAKPYAGKVVQLMAGSAAHRSYEDRRLAWSSLAQGGMEVRVVPGDHHTMVEAPHSTVLAQEIQRSLDQASTIGQPERAGDSIRYIHTTRDRNTVLAG
jgi:amino acid adenylation domain-containing protein